MGQAPVVVTVSGGGGAIGYALAFRIAAGELLGPDTPVALRLLDVDAGLPACEGVAMELADCGFPLLAGVTVTGRASIAFDGVSWVLALGAVPRRDATRPDWLAANGRLYGSLGRAVADHAAADVRVLVVGNPCAANCLVARAHAPEVPDDRWYALTRLDENRARAQLAAAVRVPATAITNLAVWGNHSTTRYPDLRNARIAGAPALDVLHAAGWCPDRLDAALNGRSAAIKAARRGPAAASAATAVLDTVRALVAGTPAGDWTSVATVSQGEYGVPTGLVFGYPVTSDGSTARVVEGLEHDEPARRRLAANTDELLEELAELSPVLPTTRV